LPFALAGALAGCTSADANQFGGIVMTNQGEGEDEMRLRGNDKAQASNANAGDIAAGSAVPDSVEAVNRLQFVQILAEASGEDIASYEENTSPFSDVADSAVTWAYAKWLVTGNDAQTFRPEALITRQEAAAILGRYLAYCYTDLPDLPAAGDPDAPVYAGMNINYATDGDTVAEWARDSVAQCRWFGIIDTLSEPFRPLDPVSAQEARQWAQNAKTLPERFSALALVEQPAFADSLVRAAQPEGNFMLSPYSARLCLAMLANGAKGNTQMELLSALQINDLSAYNEQVKQQLATYDKYARALSLNTANSLWLNQTRFGGKGTFLSTFRESMQDHYRAEVREVTSQDSVEQVNEWASDQTKGKIPSILTEENRDFAIALVNAVYFKAAWENEFYEGKTAPALFTNADGSTTQVDMMHQTEHLGYYSTPGVEAVKLDYRRDAADDEQGSNWAFFRDADFSMYFLKTDAAASGCDVQHILDQATFSTDSLVQLSIPQFKLEYSTTLDQALQALGVKAAYDAEQADLSGMADPASTLGGVLFLDTVLQKTYLAVDEKGTEAAAVTAVITRDAAAPLERQSPVRVFTADSPFWFAIRDNASQEILFIGRYETAS